MAAMTMPYKVRDAKEFADLKPGDLITSTLVVVSNDAYLKDVKKVGEAPLEKPRQLGAIASSGFELLKPGEPVPDAPFVDQDGSKTSLASFKGQPVVLTFIYTQCPMPTFCPLMDRHFVTIQERLKADPALTNVHLVDRQLRSGHRHAGGAEEAREKLGADPSRWTLLHRRPRRDRPVRVALRRDDRARCQGSDRTSRTTCGRPSSIADGKLVKAYTGNEWTPDQVLADLQKCGPSGPPAKLDRPRPCRHARAAPDRAAADAARRPALPQRACRTTRSRRPGATLRSFRGVVRHGCAHCLEAALFAAVVLEQHGYPPLVLSFESIDELDHVIFRLPGAAGDGDRSPARAIPGCTAGAGVRDAARAGAELCGSVRRLHRAGHRLRGRGPREGDGRLRLAAGGNQRLEGRAHAARLPASIDQDVGPSLPAAPKWYREYRAAMAASRSTTKGGSAGRRFRRSSCSGLETGDCELAI